MGRYLDLVKAVEPADICGGTVTVVSRSGSVGSSRSLAGESVVPTGFESGRECEKSEICEKRSVPACPVGGRAILLRVPDGVPAEWAQGVADLLAMPPHPDWPDTAWKTLQDDALAFLKDWAAQAHALDWTALDLFGVHATASRARLDGMGLVPLLNGRPVTVITESTAVISVASGGAQTYRRPSTWPTERCLVWEMSPCEAVPLGNVRLAP